MREGLDTVIRPIQEVLLIQRSWLSAGAGLQLNRGEVLGNRSSEV